MENNTNKSQAELYREERKARLAKAAAKNAKKSPKLTKVKKIAGKIVAIVLAVLIGLGAIGATLNFFGTAEKVLKVSSGEKKYSFSLAELNYYYLATWSGYQNQAYQFESSYGAGFGLQVMGYDCKKSPDAQEYLDSYAQMTGISPDVLDTESPTWADVFKYAAVSQIIQVKYGYEKAKEANLALTEEEAKKIDDEIEAARKEAKSDDFSLNRYLRLAYGNGVTEKLLRQIREESTLAAKYFTKLQEDMANAVTAEQINAKYSENKNDYDILSLRLYNFKADEAKTEDGATDADKKAAQDAENKKAKDKADAFLAAVTDEESFLKQAEAAIKAADPKSEKKAEDETKSADVTYANLSTSSEDLAKWAFDSARKLGDKTVIDAGDGVYYVVLMTVLPHKDTSSNANDVRHILVKFPEDENGKTATLTDAQKKEYKDKAQAILDEYLKNPTEDNFAALAKAKTEDPGSKENGGLYEGIKKDSNYVKAFLDWSVDAARKTGDTGIVETEYGYHVMYYVKADGEAWYETIKNEILADNFNEVTENVEKTYTEPVKLDSLLIKYTINRENKSIISKQVLRYK